MKAKSIGIDFDNTIVCYDEVFSRLVRERGLMSEGHATKGQVRDHLRRLGREDEWTALQGEAYGPALRHAKPFPGVVEFLARCRREGMPVSVISHKTRHPFLGPKHDLHEAAREWLESNGFFDPCRAGLSSSQIFFELTKVDKLKRIAEARCSHFIDDLPEFLAEPGFPVDVERILFAPEGAAPRDLGFRSAGSWSEIERFLLDS